MLSAVGVSWDILELGGARSGENGKGGQGIWRREITGAVVHVDIT
jgi:hypothetical protein